MGKSESIAEKMKKNEEFNTFMKGLEEESKEKEKQILKQIDETIQRHYNANGWDHARLFGDSKADYQNYSDWSLVRIKGIIDSIGNALQSGNFPSKQVPGSEDAEKSTVEDTKKNLKSFDDDYSLTIARVTSLISGVLTQFASSSSASQKSTFKDMPLSGGLHLFFGSSGKVFSSSDFFTNQFIGSFQIVFEVYMSVDEAKAIALKQILITTGIEIDLLNDMIIGIRKAQNIILDKLLKENKLEEFQSTSDTFNQMRENISEERNKLVKEYDKYKSVTDKVDLLMSALNLSASGKQIANHNAKQNYSLDHFFSGWSLRVAKRYLQEQLELDEA